MKKLLILLALVVLTISFVSIVGATGSGIAQLGDECNTHTQDESHICAGNLVCVPQNENSEGNGKCGYINTPSPTPQVWGSPTPTPQNTPEMTSTPTPTEEPISARPENGGSGVSDGKNDGLGCGQHDCNTFKGLSPYDGQPVGWK